LRRARYNSEDKPCTRDINQIPHICRKPNHQTHKNLHFLPHEIIVFFTTDT